MIEEDYDSLLSVILFNCNDEDVCYHIKGLLRNKNLVPELHSKCISVIDQWLENKEDIHRFICDILKDEDILSRFDEDQKNEAIFYLDKSQILLNLTVAKMALQPGRYSIIIKDHSYYYHEGSVLSNIFHVIYQSGIVTENDESLKLAIALQETEQFDETSIRNCLFATQNDRGENNTENLKTLVLESKKFDNDCLTRVLERILEDEKELEAEKM